MYPYLGVSLRSRSHVPNLEPSCGTRVKDRCSVTSGRQRINTYTRLLVQRLDDEGARANLSDHLPARLLET